MKVIRNFIDNLYRICNQKPFLARFKPVVNAVDSFFFGTDKTTTSAPHILDNIDIKRYMSAVIIALLPAAIAAIYFYGLRVLLIIAVSYIFGGLTEVIFAVVRKKEIEKGFFVTGLIFPLILPPTVPLWVVAVGIVFGVFFGKEVFGGTGRNIFNPALVGRLFITVCFPVIMTTSWQKPFTEGFGGFVHYTADAITSATPLIIWKTEKVVTSFVELLLGRTAGSIGETFRLGIILGGSFLIFTKVANYRIPLSYILSVFIFSTIGHILLPQKVSPPLFQLFSGGLLFGAFFMATDPVTTPFTKEGKWIAGVVLGLLTVLIRSFSGYVEGVMFSIILMNAFTPLIDTIVLDVKYKTPVTKR